MRTVVAVQDFLELEIKPDDLLAEFVRITEQSVRDQLVPRARDEVACPACRHGAGGETFEKFGLRYVLCRRCGSLFVSPRPPQSVIDEYYRSSEASRFWRERVVPSTEPARDAKIARPRAQWVADGLAEHVPAAVTGIALGRDPAPFVSALQQLSPHIQRLLVMDPHTAEAASTPTAPDALTLAAANGGLDFAVAFDVLDRCADPRGLVERVRAALRPGGAFFVITPSISGFDLQVLWDRSRTIMPPDRINLFSLRGFRELFAEDWEITELSTPGMFDAETVRRAILADPAAAWPRVLRQLLIETDPTALTDFQEFLQRHRLSSFARLMLRKRG